MACRHYKLYSVYDRDTDLPIIIHATSRECAEWLGIKEMTFRSYLAHRRHGTRNDKYVIYEDEPEDDEDVPSST